ncbi:hypothetical protein RB195_016294 [Necator americanus]|uniref:Uncharacterized protein n=1 Tax=Necator americanus TaxID=51031 RepID=A0ABR1E8H9_NECAM
MKGLVSTKADSNMKVATGNRLRFFGHILSSSADRLVQRVLRIRAGRGRERGDVKFRTIWNSDGWIDSGQALAENCEGFAELCSKMTHVGFERL